MSAACLAVADLGVVPYQSALDLQRSLADALIAGHLAQDALVLLEHPPVITLGRGTKPSSLPLPPAELRRRGVEVFEIERGGDVTYHGPGQLVGYPIFDLTRHRQDLHWFLRQIEEALIAALDRLAITAERRFGYTGVWTSERKIASIGIHVRQWVTWHGFALNVTTDLSAFGLIVPCGIPDVVMTSVEAELARSAARAYGPPGGGRTDAQAHRRTVSGRGLGVEVREAVVGAFVRTFEFAGAEPLNIHAVAAHRPPGTSG